MVLAQIRLLRFAHHSGAAAQVCNDVLESKTWSREMREAVFVELVEIFAETKHPDAAMQRIRESYESIKDPLLRERANALKMRILAHHSMIGRHTQQGERVLIRDVYDYYLPNDRPSSRDPVVTAEVLGWLCRDQEAIGLLLKARDKAPGNWELNRALILTLRRVGRHDEAFDVALAFAEVAPWRAESHDFLGHAAEGVGFTDVAERARRRGNEVFEQEKRLFEELRTGLDAV